MSDKKTTIINPNPFLIVVLILLSIYIFVNHVNYRLNEQDKRIEANNMILETLYYANIHLQEKTDKIIEYAKNGIDIYQQAELDVALEEILNTNVSNIGGE